MKPANKLAAVLVTVLSLLVSSDVVWAQHQDDAAAINIGTKDIGGIISSPKGREAGVWVIAETTELPTRFARIVVTDDQGRYLIPDCRAPITAFGPAATGSSTRRRCARNQGSGSISRRPWQRMGPMPPIITRRSTGILY